MAWMALGGTLKRIPQDILHLVTTTPILGHSARESQPAPRRERRDRQHAEPGEGAVRDRPADSDDENLRLEQSVHAYNTTRCDLAEPTRRTATRTRHFVDEQRTTRRCGCTSAAISARRWFASTERATPAQTRVTLRHPAGHDVLRVHPDPADAANPADKQLPRRRARLGSHARDRRSRSASRGQSLSGLPRPEVESATSLPPGTQPSSAAVQCPDFLRNAKAACGVDEDVTNPATDASRFAGQRRRSGSSVARSRPACPSSAISSIA